MNPRAELLAYWGVQNRVGATTLALWSARLQSRSKRCALLTPHPIVGFGGLSPAQGRSFRQLSPYAGQMTPSTLEHFFDRTPEGLQLVPLEDPGRMSGDAAAFVQALEILGPFFDLLVLDLPHAPDPPTGLLEVCGEVVVVSSFEEGPLQALKRLEKSLLAGHLPLRPFRVWFDQTSAQQPFLSDFSDWSGSLSVGGSLAFQVRALERQGPDLAERLRSPRVPVPSPKTSVPIFLGGTAVLAESRPLPADPEDPQRVHQLHQKLLEALRSGGLWDASRGMGPLDRENLEPKAREILDRLIQEFQVPDRDQVRRLMAQTLDLCFGFGPLEPLLRDPAVTEIMVNGPRQVFIEKDGLLEASPVRFLDEQQLRTILERILAPLGRRLDESQPTVDGRLPDGSRINAVLPPLSLNGPLLTVRKFPQKRMEIQDLLRAGALTPEAADFLGACVRAKRNLFVSGGTGSGKTTLLNILSSFIPGGERIVTIEDSAELRLSQPHVVRLESRPPNLEGKGQVTIRDLVINALRMRPDRIIVGEVRGGEALDMLQAMNTGHDGSLTTGHANSPRDMLARLETLCLFTGLNLPVRAVREQIARAIHLVVQQSRLPGGKRAVTRICEVQGLEGDVILLQDLFVREEDKGLERKPFPPRCLPELEAVGYRWPGRDVPA